MLGNQRGLRLFVTSLMLVLIVFLGFQLRSKLDYVAGCHARLAQLELIGDQATKNETALDIKEKALDAAEAKLNGKP